MNRPLFLSQNGLLCVALLVTTATDQSSSPVLLDNFAWRPRQQCVKENASYWLSCQAVNNQQHQDFNVEWLLNGTKLMKHHEYHPYHINLNTTNKAFDIPDSIHRTVVLQIKEFNHLLNNTKFQCVARNAYGESRTKTIKLIHCDKPQFVHDVMISPKTLKLPINGTADIICFAHGSPNPTVSLNLQDPTNENANLPMPAAIDRRMSFEAYIGKEDHRETYVYKIRRLKRKDAGVYKCKAENEMGTIQRSTQVIVLEPPYFVKPMDKVVKVESGTNVLLNCWVAGGDLNITWHRDNHIISFDPKNGRMMLSSSNSILTIHNVSSADQGNYRCQAVNNDGIVNGSLQLVVDSFISKQLWASVKGWIQLHSITFWTIVIIPSGSSIIIVAGIFVYMVIQKGKKGTSTQTKSLIHEDIECDSEFENIDLAIDITDDFNFAEHPNDIENNNDQYPFAYFYYY